MMRTLLFCLWCAACTRAAAASPPIAADAPDALARQGGLTPVEAREHLLSRVTFGAREADRARLARLGAAGFLEEQLHPASIDDSALDARLAKFDVVQEGSDVLVRKLVAQRKARRHDAVLKDAPPAPDDEQATPAMMAARPKRDLILQLSSAKLLRAVASQRQLQEVMVDFWFNHFNVFAGKQEEAALLPEYEQHALRPNALGSFRTLLEATAHSPAMLIYLDNWRSTRRKGINENYARELLELHTLGVDGGYTQRDVQEIARCFTGWTVDTPFKQPRFVFRPGMHDFGPKVVLGHAIPPGGGVEDGLTVLRILEQHPSTARFIARKLARRFVSDEPPSGLVERVAKTYERTRGDIASMLRTIFESPEFWNRSALKAKVRSPLELVAFSLRALDASVDDPSAPARAVARIGEPLYGSQPPTGYPDFAQTWLSSGALLARIDFGLRLASGRLPGVSVDLSQLSGPDMLDQVAARLGATELSETTRDAIPARVAPEQLVGLLLGAPEVQRR
ncbi:MAG TPA: DUF1800 domain-containing protein [Myxococcales bacterium]|nr:DUF1800 domain-containing protein [Myxococcales bacterium]